MKKLRVAGSVPCTHTGRNCSGLAHLPLGVDAFRVGRRTAVVLPLPHHLFHPPVFLEIDDALRYGQETHEQVIRSWFVDQVRLGQNLHSSTRVQHARGQCPRRIKLSVKPNKTMNNLNRTCTTSPLLTVRQEAWHGKVMARKASTYQSSQAAFVLGGLLQHGNSSTSNGWIVAIYLSHQHLDAPLFRTSVIRGRGASALGGQRRISQPLVRRASTPQCSSHPVERKQPELAGGHKTRGGDSGCVSIVVCAEVEMELKTHFLWRRNLPYLPCNVK